MNSPKFAPSVINAAVDVEEMFRACSNSSMDREFILNTGHKQRVVSAFDAFKSSIEKLLDRFHNILARNGFNVSDPSYSETTGELMRVAADICIEREKARKAKFDMMKREREEALRASTETQRSAEIIAFPVKCAA